MTGFAMILLRLTEEVVMYLEDWKAGKKPELTVSWHKRNGWDARELKNFKCLLEIAEGVDLDTVDESGNEILGTSIKEICDEIPDTYRILHVEPVFRMDLVTRFRRRQKKMMDEILLFSYYRLRECVSGKIIPTGSSRDNKRGLAEEICKPRVSFHGTQRHVIPSIVRHGFIKPGDKAGNEDIEVRCGASFGVGIYSSPWSEYSLFYANMSDGSPQKTRPEDIPGLRLIVCAVLMGRALQVTRDDTRRTTEIADKTAHSHVSPNGFEYIVFDAAQIIPCYVLHLDLGVQEARKAMRQAPADPSSFKKSKTNSKWQPQELFPGELERIKQAKQAAAAKWFPFGYGPAKGTSFVIEEIAEHSDDEEDYGQYQAQRQEVGTEIREHAMLVDGASWFDEYQQSRTGYTTKKVMTSEEDDDND
jgi:hypothetical protein